MNKVITLLDCSPQAYEDQMLNTYMRWCMDFAINYEADLQALVANSSLNAYFLTEYKKLEDEFVRLASNYQDTPTVTNQDIRNLYNRCTYPIFNRRCMPLVLSAKKLKVIAYVN